jgi:hypothetical protein
MLLFTIILIAILLVYIAVCSVIFIYHHPQRLVSFVHTIAIIMLFLLTGYFLGVKAMAITIVVYFAVTGGLTFVLRLLSKLKYTIDPSVFDRDNFSCNHKKHSNLVSAANIDKEKQNQPAKLSRLFLCAFVPLWLTGFLAAKTFNSAFSCGNYSYSLTFQVKNKLTVIFKNIQAA